MAQIYVPISCSLHDEYELAIMQSKIIEIQWLDDEGQRQRMHLQPKDIFVENKEEFLIAVNSKNQTFRIRLDKITLLS